MKCSEFVENFSEFQDAPDDSSIKKKGEKHLLECEKCTHYSLVVVTGVRILQEIPPVELPENFWASLEHRIFHVRHGKILKDSRPISSITSFAVACAFVLLVVLFENSSIVGNLKPDVNLPAIVVSRPSMQQSRTPRSLSTILGQPSNSRFVNRFWEDINDLIYEYSTMSERYRTSPVLRQTDLVEYK
ncbi:MAG TPA: hypothetical protein EYQ69_07535 [Gemmatimonadetes bacterium]|nr:hypothetical protein [Gemmatimonadota bacterium]